MLLSVKSERQLTAAKHKVSDSTDLVLPTERRTPRCGGGTPRSGGGARTPRDERAKNRSNQQSTEDLRVQKSREILLRPGMFVSMYVRNTYICIYIYIFLQ